MSRGISHAAIVAAIVRKDLSEYLRDRLWAFLTALVLIVVVGLFWILPDTVDESIGVGVSGLDPAALAGMAGADEQAGLGAVAFDTDTDLRSVIAGDAVAWSSAGAITVTDPSIDGPEGAEKVEVAIGIAFPPDFVASAAAGERTEVTIYVDAAVPPEIRTALSGFVREMAHAIAGDPLPVATPDTGEVYVVLGQDRLGDQPTARDAFRPLFVFLVLLMEMFVMASLIAREIQERTVTAILVTPATVGDVLAAKGIAGAASGLTQAVIVLIAIGSFGVQPLLLLTLALLGSIMVSGVAMLAGSVGKDFISTLFQGMVFMIPLLIPAFAAMLPGDPSGWVRAMPSYPLVRGLVDVTSAGAGWAETLPELGLLSAWCLTLFAAGWVVLKRKVQAI